MANSKNENEASEFLHQADGAFWKYEFLKDPSFVEFIDLIPEAAIFSRPDGSIALTNITAQKIFGYSQAEFDQISVDDMAPEAIRALHPAMRASFFENPMPRYLDSRTVELNATRKDGSIFPMASALFAIQTDEGPLAVNLLRDITEEKAQAAKIEEMAFVDALTNLPNRRYFDTNMARNVARAERYDQQIALLFIDLDHFKPINDQHGHDVGDAVLKEIASRIALCVRTSDFVARIGGDEFVVMVYPYTPEEDLRVFAQRLIDVCSEPLLCNGEVYQLSASIGIAVNEPCVIDGTELLSQADKAMYAAKEKGGACFVEFDELKNL